MARMTRPLTNTEILKAKPRGKRYQLRDGRGLELFVEPSGHKRWYLNYSKPITKKRTYMKLGDYPEISLAEARELRLDCHRLLIDGIDPQEHKQEQARKAREAQSNTLRAVAKCWLDLKKSSVTPDYALDLERALENHVFPLLGDLPVHRINARQTIDVLQPLAKQQKLETIKRLCISLNQIMDYAVNTGIMDVNPLHKIRAAFSSPKRQNLATIEPDQLPELVETVEGASIRTTTRCLLLWQLHTMTRPAEAAGARWDEIDFENKVWKIPAERMKRRRTHVIPLTKQTLDLLEEMEPISGHRNYIFPSERNPREPANSQNTNMALKRMGYKGKLVAHGMRALASTTLNEQGFEEDLVESALAHAVGNQTRAAYLRTDFLERRREMMEWWSKRIGEASDGLLRYSERELQMVIHTNK